jgi:hypothetical protein
MTVGNALPFIFSKLEKFREEILKTCLKFQPPVRLLLFVLRFLLTLACDQTAGVIAHSCS